MIEPFVILKFNRSHFGQLKWHAYVNFTAGIIMIMKNVLEILLKNLPARNLVLTQSIITLKMAINTSEIQPKVWKRYVDDSFCVIKMNAVNSFQPHLIPSTHISH